MSHTVDGLEDKDQEASLRLMLPSDFQPSHTEVLIGRGRKIYNHSGNIKFRELIKMNLVDYKTATCKHDKTAIIAHIIRQVEAESHLRVGGFVRYNKGMQRWFAVDDITKRATTAQAFRDSLHSNYKSSKQNKRYKRLSERVTAAPSPTGPVHNFTARSSECWEAEVPDLWEPSPISKEKKTTAQVTQDLKDSLARSLHLLESFDPPFQDNLTVPNAQMGITLPECPWENLGQEIHPYPQTVLSRPLGQKNAEELERTCLTSFFASLEERLGDTVMVSDPFEPVPMAVTPPVSGYTAVGRNEDILPDIAALLGDDEPLGRPHKAQNSNDGTPFPCGSGFPGQLY